MTLAAINGHPVERLSLHIPAGGVWWAWAELIDDPEVSGPAALTLGPTELVGTVDPSDSSTFGLRRRLCLSGGAGGWGTLLEARGYHSDAEVSALSIVQDLASSAGETLGDFEPEASTVGVDFVREAGPASRGLERAIGSAAWWVGLDGVTVVGSRPEVEANASAYHVVNDDGSTVELALTEDDIREVLPGTTLSAGLDAPRTVRGLRVELTPEGLRILAWAPSVTASRGRLQTALRSIIERATDPKLYGMVRYRVAKMIGDRVDLQKMRPGYPDIGPITMRPGVAGAHAEMIAGAEVFVMFEEGDPTKPVVMGFAGKGEPGHEPEALTVGSVDSMTLTSGTVDVQATTTATIEGGSAVVAEAPAVRLGSSSATDASAREPSLQTHLAAVATELDAIYTTLAGGTPTPAPNYGTVARAALLLSAPIAATKVFVE